MTNTKSFTPTHEVILEGWWHKFKKGELVQITDETGYLSGHPRYENGEGLRQALESNEVKPITHE